MPQLLGQQIIIIQFDMPLLSIIIFYIPLNRLI